MMKIYTIVVNEKKVMALDMVLRKLKITSTGFYGSIKHENLDGEIDYYKRCHVIMGVFSCLRLKLTLRFLNCGDANRSKDIYIWANDNGIENQDLCRFDIPQTERPDKRTENEKGKHER